MKISIDANLAVEVRFTENGETVNVTETFEAENENSAEPQWQGWQNIVNNFKSHVERIRSE